MRGKVKWFNAEKRFGFITREDGGTDAFVHLSDVEGSAALAEEDAVEFNLGQDNRGRPKAVKVRKIR